MKNITHPDSPLGAFDIDSFNVAYNENAPFDKKGELNGINGGLYILFREVRKQLSVSFNNFDNSKLYEVSVSFNYGEVKFEITISAEEIEFPDLRTINPNKVIKAIFKALREALESNDAK